MLPRTRQTGQGTVARLSQQEYVHARLQLGAECVPRAHTYSYSIFIRVHTPPLYYSPPSPARLLGHSELRASIRLALIA